MALMNFLPKLTVEKVCLQRPVAFLHFRAYMFLQCCFPHLYRVMPGVFKFFVFFCVFLHKLGLFSSKYLGYELGSFSRGLQGHLFSLTFVLTGFRFILAFFKLGSFCIFFINDWFSLRLGFASLVRLRSPQIRAGMADAGRNDPVIWRSSKSLFVNNSRNRSC